MNQINFNKVCVQLKLKKNLIVAEQVVLIVKCLYFAWKYFVFYLLIAETRQ